MYLQKNKKMKKCLIENCKKYGILIYKCDG